MTQPLGLADGSVLVSVTGVSGAGLLAIAGPWSADSALVSIDVEGRERFRCALPAGEVFMSGAALVAERSIAASRQDLSHSRLEAFDVPGLSMAPAGSVGESGGPARQGRPR